jgi:hypothetical protein
MPDLLRRLRHHASRGLLATVKRGDLFEVPVEKCVNPFGFSFGKQGWHPLVAHLREDAAPAGGGVLKRFHDGYQPRSMRCLPEAAGMEVEFDPGFFRYPWGNFKIGFDEADPVKDRSTSRFCGPTEPLMLEKEAAALRRLADSMALHTYDPWKYPNTFVGGVRLVREDGDFRYVVLQGNHRLAVMSHLGQASFQAVPLDRHLREVREADIGSWHYVRSGRCSRADARKYFDAFFLLDGRERAGAFLPKAPQGMVEA